MTITVENASKEELPHVLIIGAGFGGLEAAKKLANKNVRVSLLDKHNHHLFQPLLYQVATAVLTAAEIAAPVRHIFRKNKNIAVYMNEVVAIDKEQKIVRSLSGREFSYDYLIVATGARHSYFGRDEWAKVAPGLKSIEDAREIRQRVLTAFEKAEMADTITKREAYLNFVIVGAGPTGVELAGAISELARYTLKKDFNHITPGSARIILVDAGSRVLGTFHESLSEKARRHLEDLGVEIHLNSAVKDITSENVTFGDYTIPTRTVIWAAGVQASPAGKWLNVETDRAGKILIDEFLNINNHPEIYAIGDTASYTPPQSTRPLPGTAPVAKQMGDFVAKDILRRIENQPRKAFHFKDYGTMATIGRNKAIADIRGLRISGFPGWLLWGLAHIYFLIGYRNRIIVTLQWLWSYITYQRGVRLIIGGGRISDLPYKNDDNH